MKNEKYLYEIQYLNGSDVWIRSIDTKTHNVRLYISLEEGLRELSLCRSKENDGLRRRLINIETKYVVAERCGGCRLCF